MKKHYAWMLAVVVVGAVAVGTSMAQEEDAEGAGGEMPPWMKKTPVHAKLAKTVGTYDVATEFWMAPGEPQKGTAVAVRKMILGGMWLQESFKMDWDGMPFEGRLISGYDTVRGKLVSTWIDNMSPVMGVQYGEEKDGMLVYHGEDPGMDGKLQKAKATVEFKGDGWIFSSYHVKPDGDVLHMRLTYTPRK